MEVADVAQIWRCCGCSWQLQSDYTPSLGTSICRGTALKKKKHPTVVDAWASFEVQIQIPGLAQWVKGSGIATAVA